MMEEYSSIMKNDVWEIVPSPEGKSVVTSRWLYKLKYDADGSIEKYKARFVARGFSQGEGIDYDETLKLVLWLGVSHRVRELTMMRPSLRLLDILLSGQ
jgi:hypothetical protein